MINILRKIRRSLELRQMSKRRADVLFYAAGLIDETWIRSTVLECHRRNRSCLVISAGGFSPDAVRDYRSRGIRHLTNVSMESTPKVKAELVVTASSGLPRSLFDSDAGAVVHMPHSLVSLHMIYPENAFDGYDVLFASGPHHVEEFASISKLRGRKDRKAISVGYGKFDLMKQTDLPEGGLVAEGSATKPIHVLIAPSWGSHGLLPSIGYELVGKLLRDGFRVTLRPHPQHVLSGDPALRLVSDTYAQNEDFQIESPDDPAASMYLADLLVTDYSGTAFEYTWLRRRPVLFVDVPRKIVNDNWQSVGIEPVEVRLREKLGVVAAADAQSVSRAAMKLVHDANWRARIESAIPLFLYEDQSCCCAAADAIDNLLADRRKMLDAVA